MANVKEAAMFTRVFTKKINYSIMNSYVFHLARGTKERYFGSNQLDITRLEKHVIYYLGRLNVFKSVRPNEIHHRVLNYMN